MKKLLILVLTMLLLAGCGATSQTDSVQKSTAIMSRIDTILAERAEYDDNIELKNEKQKNIFINKKQEREVTPIDSEYLDNLDYNSKQN